MFIGSCEWTKMGLLLLGMDSDLPAQSHANPRTNWRDGETDWLNPGHDSTFLVGERGAATKDSKWGWKRSHKKGGCYSYR